MYKNWLFSNVQLMYYILLITVYTQLKLVLTVTLSTDSWLITTDDLWRMADQIDT